MKFLIKGNEENTRFLNAFPQPKAGRVDKLLTSLSLMETNENFLHDKILPKIANLKDDSGLIAVHGNEHLRVWESKRAVFDESQHRVEFDIGTNKRYDIEYHDITVYLPDRIIKQFQSPFDARRDTQIQLEQSRNIQQEVAIADALSSTTIMTQNITLTGTSQWSDFANSDPIDDLETGIETGRLANGKRLNKLILGTGVVSKLKQHPDMVNRITGLTKSLTEPQLFQILKDTLNLDEVLVGDARKITSQKGQTTTKGDVWGDVAVLFFVPNRPSLMSQSFGYRFELAGENKRIVIRPGPNADKGDLIELGWAFQDKLLDVTNAYLIKDVLA